MSDHKTDPKSGKAHVMRAGRALCILSVALALSVVACGGGPNQQEAQTQTQAPSQTDTKTYHLAGTVVSIDKDQNHLVVNAGDIPGFMSAMTMPYPVADPETLNRVGVGDQITADIVLANGQAKLQNVVVVKKGTGAPPSPSGANRAPGAPGANNKTPDFALVNQNGKRVHLDQYRGKALLLTFIYTRCPFPDYCPLMTHNFAQIEKNLAATPDLYAKTHLLSISFDPKYDTPAILRTYAMSYVADPKKPPFDHWEFASILEPERADIGHFFNLFVDDQGGGQITHSMSTAIIDPDGNLYRSYSDSSWKPADVLNDLTAAVMPQQQQRSAIPSSRDRS
jgi:protein SCO1/2